MAAAHGVEDAVHEFVVNGYAHLPRIISPETVEAMRAAWEPIRDTVVGQQNNAWQTRGQNFCSVGARVNQPSLASCSMRESEPSHGGLPSSRCCPVWRKGVSQKACSEMRATGCELRYCTRGQSSSRQ